MTTQFFDENSRDFAHRGMWSDPRRDALATSIFALSCPKSPTCAKCDTTLGIARFLKWSDKCQVSKDNSCVAACLRVVKACLANPRICGNSVDFPI